MKAMAIDRLTSAFHRIGACCCSSNWASNERGSGVVGGPVTVGHVVTSPSGVARRRPTVGSPLSPGQSRHGGEDDVGSPAGRPGSPASMRFMA